MKRRDVLWIALIWIAALGFGATVAVSYADDHPRIETAALTGSLAVFWGGMATGLYVLIRRNVHDRHDVLWIAGIWIPLLGASAVLGAATGNFYGAGFAVGIIGALLTGSYFDHRRGALRARAEAVEEDLRRFRPCPKCKARMLRAADSCPICHSPSTPWIRHGGLWWMLDGDGKWHWWDEEAGGFEPYRASGRSANARAADPHV